MPNRIIKETICTSDSLDGLNWFEEVFFYRLLVTVDDFGRFDGRPAILKSRMFPLKSVSDKQVNDAIEKLREAGLLTTYFVDGKPYIQITTWAEHQRIRNSRKKYPSPEEADAEPLFTDNSPQLAATRGNSPPESNPIQSNPNPILIQSESFAALFQKFWNAYPKKVAKPAGEKAFKALGVTEPLLADILAGVNRWKQSEQWTKDGGQFIPNPATFLNGRRWEDQVPTGGKSKKKSANDNYQPREYDDAILDKFVQYAVMDEEEAV